MTELLIIRTENNQELKAFLQAKKIDYEIYPYDAKQARRERWLRDLELANQDEKRNKEIAEWEVASEEDDWTDLEKENEWKFS